MYTDKDSSLISETNIIDIHGHRFEIHTLASQIHENIDIALGIKNVFKLEAETNL